MQMQTEEINCPFCDVPGEFRFSQEGWNTLTCPSCRLMFISPRPTAKGVAELYEQDSAHGSSMVHLRHFGTSVSKLSANRAVRLIKKDGPAVGRILEIGPGAGSFLIAARDAGYEVAGVELNPVEAEHIRSLGIPCWSSLDDVEGTFDVVYHCDVLSHLYDPVATFRQIRSMLNPSGFHMFETGEGDINPKYWRLIGNWQLPDHLFTFSDASMRSLLNESGYELVKIRRYATALARRIKVRIDSALGRVNPPIEDVPAVSTETFVPLQGSAPKERSKKEAAAITALSYPFHFMCYGLGRFLPRKGRPQVVFVVAQRVAFA